MHSGFLVDTSTKSGQWRACGKSSLSLRPDCWTRAQRKVGLGTPNFGPLNGRSGEIRCAAKRGSLHLRGNAASAKLEKPMSGLSRLADLGVRRS